MENYTYYAAWVSLILSVFSYIAYPFHFGESREPFTPHDWILKLFLFVILKLPILLFVIKTLGN